MLQYVLLSILGSGDMKSDNTSARICGCQNTDSVNLPIIIDLVTSIVIRWILKVRITLRKLRWSFSTYNDTEIALNEQPQHNAASHLLIKFFNLNWYILKMLFLVFFLSFSPAGDSAAGFSGVSTEGFVKL